MSNSDSRGVRNKNPGNIVRYKDQWLGMAADQSTDPRFVVFESPNYGIRAMAKILRTYKKKYKCDSVSAVIARWAPASENDTLSYIDFVLDHTKFDGQIDLDNKKILFLLIESIIIYENGFTPYSAPFIRDSIAMAFDEDEKPRLPGAPIFFDCVVNTGSHSNHYGVGDMDFSLRRAGTPPQSWVDLGSVNFSDPTEEQYLDAQTSSYGSCGFKANADILRRPSFMQAQLVNDVIRNALTKAFNGEIPADDEIDQWRKANGF